MSDTYPHQPVTITGDKPYTAAELDHQRWMNRPRVEVEDNGPRVITIQPPPSDAELEARRKARHRPSDRSPRAVQIALDAVVSDLATANVALIGRQEAAAHALSSGAAPAVVKAARDALELKQIEVDQLCMMEAGLRVSLENAHQSEAEEDRALADRVPAAEAKVAAFRKFIERDYPGLAAKIYTGLALEEEAEQAHRTLAAAAHRLPGVEHPAPLPRAANGTITEAYRYRSSLPGTGVQPRAAWAPSGGTIQY